METDVDVTNTVGEGRRIGQGRRSKTRKEGMDKVEEELVQRGVSIV